MIDVNNLNDVIKMSKSTGPHTRHKILTTSSVRKTLLQKLTDSTGPDTLQVYVNDHVSQ